MRTSEQTYLASLGFRDKDKGNPLHDGACLYLLQDEKRQKLLDTIGIVDLFEPSEKTYSDTPNWQFSTTYIEKYLSVKQESKIGWLSHPLKNDRQYIVGYFDVLVATDYKIEKETKEILRKRTPDKPFHEWDIVQETTKIECSEKYGPTIVVEVKAGRTSIAQNIQQINTYKSFVNTDYHFVLATLYPLSNIEKTVLKQEEVIHVYLDPSDIKKFMQKNGLLA